MVVERLREIRPGVSDYREPTQHLRGVQDVDVAIAAERKQIVIAGDDDCGFRSERAGDHVIVVRITDDLRVFGGPDELCEREIVAEHLVDGTVDHGDALGELRA